jgi:ferredoxin--NADP+ reductase
MGVFAAQLLCDYRSEACSRIPAAKELPSMPVELNATVTKRDEINHGLLVIRVSPDFPLPEFTAGQYVVLALPGSQARIDYAEPEDPPPDSDKLIKRAYSIASSSQQGEYLEFYVALVHSGALTPRLFALREGDRIWLSKKIVGMFTLADITPGHDILFVATGTGLAPYLSMLRSDYGFESGRKTVVIHGARVSWDLGYMRELTALSARWPDFHYLPIIDEPERDPEWPGKVGFVYEYIDDGTVARLLGHGLEPDRTSVFLCGNPLMIEGMEKVLLGKGFRVHSRRDPGNIFVEKFWAD